MKRYSYIALLAALLLVFCVGCTKAPGAEGTPTVVPEAIATPEPTPVTVEFEIAQDTPEETDDSKDILKNLVISDADVDFILSEEVHGWEQVDVITEFYDRQTMFYIVPEGETEVEGAIGAVLMSFDEDKVNMLSCQVFLQTMKKNETLIQNLYNYYMNTFPLEVVGNLDEASWKSVGSYIDMRFETAVAAANSGTETRDLCGQFVYHIAKDLISFDFYVE